MNDWDDDDEDDVDAWTRSHQNGIMENLVEALRKGEEPPRSKLKEIIESTMMVEIPTIVRQYIARRLITTDISGGKRGRQMPSILDEPDVEAIFGGGRRKEHHMKEMYNELKEEGKTHKEACDIIATKFAGRFRNKKKPSYATVRRIVYSKKYL